jgi:hypothetical protein
LHVQAGLWAAVDNGGIRECSLAANWGGQDRSRIGA